MKCNESLPSLKLDYMQDSQEVAANDSEANIS